MAARQIEQLGIEQAWELTRGAGVRVAVLDCGIITSAALPAGRVEGISASGGAEDATSDSHGTSCGSLIGSQAEDASGVAPEASLLSVQIMTARDSLSAADVTRGLQRALERDCDVISCSFTLSRFGGQQKQISALVRQAHLRGIPVIAAHGNTLGEPAPFPEAVQHAIVVSAHDQAFEVMPVNHNQWTDVFALGDEVDVVNGDGLARSWVGNTSGAAAIVSGAVALALAAVDPNQRARVGMAMDGLLKASASPMGRGARGLPRLRLNASALLQLALAL